MKSFLVTGASKGLGLEFTKQYLHKGFRVFGLSRHPQDSNELRRLGDQFPGNLMLFKVDVGDEKARQSFYQQLCTQTESLELLINSAGILSSNEEFSFAFGNLRQEDLCKTLQINAIAPLMLVQQVIPLLKNGAIVPKKGGQHGKGSGGNV